jgi:hypothetical protein
MATTTPALYDVHAVQALRLLDEIASNVHIMVRDSEDLARSMDLSLDEVDQLWERLRERWQELKPILCPRPEDRTAGGLVRVQLDELIDGWPAATRQTLAERAGLPCTTRIAYHVLGGADDAVYLWVRAA